MFAVLDLETTGGKYGEERITEVAVFIYDGNEIVDKFISLVNPQKEIQRYVQELTGITTKSVRNAPKFHEIARRIVEITEHCILVAHNASFDYRMLQQEFRSLGYEYKRDTLCTVELSKRLIPDAEAYNLGKLAKHLGIPIQNRHRAEGDALATVQLLRLLLDKDADHAIKNTIIKHHHHKSVLPKCLNLLHQVPPETGVFYLYDGQQNIIHVQKSNNMYQRVSSIFSSTHDQHRRLQQVVEKVHVERTGSLFIAKLLEQHQKSISENLEAISVDKNPLHELPYSDFLLIDKGRKPAERSAVVVQNAQLIGFLFFHYSMQYSNADILAHRLTKLNSNNWLHQSIFKQFQKTNPKKILPLRKEEQ
ncbi:MAG: exonuclease domain-containing protein [Flavobacteriaceae bacterium]|nr:exonuclease domain-containing protein [Flavobacteriaceae bacterium]